MIRGLAMRRDLQLSRAETALVVIDIQDRLAAVMPAEARARAVHNTEILVRGMQALGVPILVTEQYPKGLGPTVAPLRAALGDQPITDKLDFDASAVPAFVERWNGLGRKTAVLCGMETHICVLQTATGLMGRGIDVWVAEDAVVSRIDANRSSGLRLLEAAGAVVAPTEAILFRLLGKAGTPEFKAIANLVK